MRSPVVSRLTLLASFLVVGCNRSRSNNQRLATTASISFPALQSLTDAASITIRGRISGTNVQAVTINGVPASSSDGFATFSANLPLALGPNEFVVSITDGNLFTNESDAVVDVRRVDVALVDPVDLAPEDSAHALLIDASRLELLRVDLATGARTIVSGPTTGSGPPFVAPTALVVLPAGGIALVADSGVIFSVNVATGARTVLADDAGTGTGPALGTIRDLTIGVLPHVYVASATANAILDLDAGNGDRVELSGPAVGVGTLWGEPTGVAVHATGLYVVDQTGNALFDVDLATGDRTLLADDVIGAGPSLDQPVRVRNAPLLARVLVTSRGGAAVLSVDPVNGNRTEISGPVVGGGPALVDPVGLAVPGSGTRIFLIEHGPSLSVVSVDVATGDRVEVSDFSLGAGTAFDTPVDLDLEPARGRLVVLDAGEDALVAVSLLTGNRATISSNGSGTSPVITGSSVVIDPGFNRALVPVGQELVAVNLTTGARTVLSSAAVGTGPLWNVPNDIDIDAPNLRAIVTDGLPSAVFAVDLATGNRTIVSDAATGSGPLFQAGISGIAFDATLQRAVVVDGAASAVVGVDLVNGARTILAAGPLLLGGVALDLDPNRTRAYASRIDQVNLVELQLGTVTVVSETGVEPGPALGTVTGMRFDAKHEVLWSVSPDSSSAILVDAVTGERVIVSR